MSRTLIIDPGSRDNFSILKTVGTFFYSVICLVLKIVKIYVILRILKMYVIPLILNTIRKFFYYIMYVISRILNTIRKFFYYIMYVISRISVILICLNIFILIIYFSIFLLKSTNNLYNTTYKPEISSNYFILFAIFMTIVIAILSIIFFIISLIFVSTPVTTTPTSSPYVILNPRESIPVTSTPTTTSTDSIENIKLLLKPIKKFMKSWQT